MEAALIMALLTIAGSKDGIAATAPKIRVRIGDGAKSIAVRGFDLRIHSAHRRQDLKLAQSAAYRPAPEPVSWGGSKRPLLVAPPREPAQIKMRQSARSDRLSEWRFSCPSAGVVRAVKLGVAKDPPMYFAGPISVESPSGFVSVEKRPYREKIMIHPISSRGKWTCEAVNHVDIESYLDGLVNSEFSAAWDRDAIDAQVISARTYAVYQSKWMAAKKGGSHFDLDSTTKDQVYDGSLKEDYRSRLSSIRTRGMILKASKNAAWPIKAYYHSTCGGRTELPQVVWGSKSSGFKRRVRCDHCRASPSFIWDVPLHSREIAGLLTKGARALGTAERDKIRNWPVSWERELATGTLLSLQVSEQNVSGRAERVTSKWRSAEGKEFTLSLPGTLFRIWVGPSRLKSTVFQILAAGNDSWVLRGRGFGHGVGLCQWGAKVMGEIGKSSRQILKFYYPDAVVAKAW